MFAVANIYGINPSTLLTEVIRVTSRQDYTYGGNTWEPYIEEMLNFSETLFEKGTTSGDTKVGVGELVVSNNKGQFDKYKNYGFDGQDIEVFLLEEPTEAPDASKLYFRGTIDYAEPELERISFVIRNRLEELDVATQVATFAGTNAGPVGLEGTADDLKGKIKPQTWGYCLNIPMVCVNSSKLIYACNFDRSGNRKAVAQFNNVMDKGGEIIYEGNVANSTFLDLATPSAGKYIACLAEGLIRLGTVPKGDVTADVMEVEMNNCAAPYVVERIMQSLGFVSGVDYDYVSLTKLAEKNSQPVGYYIDDDETALDVCQALLDSIGGWIAPTRLGMFRVGRVDLPANTGQQSVYTFDQNIFLNASLKRTTTGDKGLGIPCRNLELMHSRLWKTMNNGQLLESLSAATRTFLTNEYRSVSASSTTVPLVHKQAPSLQQKSLLVEPRPLKVRNGDFSNATLATDWDTVSVAGAATLVVTSNQCVMTPAGSNYTLGQFIGLGGTTTVKDEAFPGDYVLTFDLVSGVNVTVTLLWNGVSIGTFVPAAIGSQSYNFTTSGLQTTGLELRFNPTNVAGVASTIDNVKIMPRVYGTPTPQAECDRRFTILSGNPERYTLEVPFALAKTVSLGDLVTLQFPRYSMNTGKDFVVIGREEDQDDETRTFDLYG